MRSQQQEGGWIMKETRPRVLYVDDNPKSSRLLAGVLRDCGFEVITADDPAEALGQFRNTIRLKPLDNSETCLLILHYLNINCPRCQAQN